MALPHFVEYWGKAQPDAPPPYPGAHPVVYHSLDVAACVGALLDARPGALARGAALLRLPLPDARRLLVALAALHDLGKFAPAFQVKVEELWPARLGARDPSRIPPGRHTDDGYALWSRALAPLVAERLWPGAEDALTALAPAVFGHHGAPTGSEPRILARCFPGSARADAIAAAEAMLALLAYSPIEAPPLDVERALVASWWVAGLMVVADWIGSGQRWFRYTAAREDDPTLAGYWRDAQVTAVRAVREAGLATPPTASASSYPVLLGHAGWTPTPAQAWTERMPLPHGPALFVVEDVTGAGKTEAAHMLVHRLIVAGRAAGAFWAMPTQATANAMYDRQAAVFAQLFAAGADTRPSLVLAHGQQRLHDGFRATVLDGASRPTRQRGADGSRDADLDDAPGTATCSAFLADDRRAALLADVGAGTVDQALLAVLPSRFNALRLFALSDRVLVVDEAHAYDAYMSTELAELLRFHAALGGSAVVLSATLAAAQRAQLCTAWTDGLRLGGHAHAPDGTRSEPGDAEAAAYPLVTCVSTKGTSATGLPPARWSRRSVSVRFVHDAAAACEHLVAAARRGAAVAWIRNTVDDCLAAADMIRALGCEPLVFHARFAQGDRQAREREVLARLGKGAPAPARAGCVLVATQVAEQSLDFDVDAMVSDVAPVDLLVQRAGRLWRHASREPGERAGCACELVVLAPVPTADPPADWLGGPFAGTAHVYANAGVLWRSVRALHAAGAIVTPDGLRSLVEAVYGSTEVPDTLWQATQRAQGAEHGGAAAATYGTLKVRIGYDASQSAWLSDLRVPTRLGDETTTLRLARPLADGTLAPWCADPVPWRAWALSEVRVRRSLAPADAASPPEWAAAVEAVRATWGRFEQDVPVLVLEQQQPDGTWTGRLSSPTRRTPSALRYGADTGLLRHVSPA